MKEFLSGVLSEAARTDILLDLPFVSRGGQWGMGW